jgi:hypothetical protein
MMINISEDKANLFAPNANAITNAKSLVTSGMIIKAFISEDESYIRGECLGSGAENYKPSVDFIKPENPVFRCSCPSRQSPCKHALGLLYLYLSSKSKFKSTEIPPDITEKRKKQSQHEEKKEILKIKPKKKNISSLVKKINIQMEGLDILEKFIIELVKNGFSMINQKTIDEIKRKIKDLGNYYLTGPQAKLKSFLYLFEDADNNEKIYTRAIDSLTGLYSLVKRAKEYLEARTNDPELKMDDKTSMEEWLGHAWQLDELKAYGLILENVELAQISFDSFSDYGREEEVDRGYWINLASGEINATYNYRPFRAKKYVKEEDSFFEVVVIKELFIYPGDMNRRIRWNEFVTRNATKADYEKIRGFGNSSFAETIKTVKNRMKNPLGDKNPVVLLSYKKIVKIGDHLVLIDENGDMLTFDSSEEFDHRSIILNFLNKSQLENNAILVMFTMNIDNLELRIVPLSLITDEGITRLFY